MTPDGSQKPSSSAILGLGALTFVLLFMGFSWNIWQVAEAGWFQTHERSTEGHVVGRMVKSRRDGIFSAAGLLGVVAQQPDGIPGAPSALELQRGQQQWPRDSLVEFQYEAYRDNLPFDTYLAYLSQSGGQGMMFSLMSALSPLAPGITLESFHLLTAALSALALTLVILWFGREFGGVVAGVLILTTSASQWLVVFGRNLWWSLWAFYLPMTALLYLLRRARGVEVRSQVIGLAVFIAVLIKCLANGFEYITTTLVMMFVPLVYYGVLEGWNSRRVMKAGLAATTGASLAIALALTVLVGQVAAVAGSPAEGLSHLVFSLGARTHGAPESFPASYAKNLEAGTLQVLLVYLKGVFFDLNNYVETKSSLVARFLFSIRFLYLIALFGIMSFWVMIRESDSDPGSGGRKDVALVWATWVSFLAPLSWFIIFKAHSHEHPHMNHVVWHMPFTLFGFALCGVAMKRYSRATGSRTGKE